MKFHELIYDIPCYLKTVFKIIFIKDPCKSNKCLVKACCSEDCDKKIEYQNLYGGKPNVIFQKVFTIMIVVTWIGFIFLLFLKYI